MRNVKGQFISGISGNPEGRPRGAKNTATVWREQIERHIPEILEVLATKAKDGDVTAAKLLIERVLPSQRASTVDMNVASAVRQLSNEELLDLAKKLVEAPIIELSPCDEVSVGRSEQVANSK